MTKILKHSTSRSIAEFKSGKIDLYTLRNRSSTKRIRDNTKEMKKAYDKKIYKNLTEEQLEEKELETKSIEKA